MSDQFGDDGVGGFDWQTARMEADKAEIERLRGLLSDVQIVMDSHNNIVGNLQGEIERLRDKTNTSLWSDAVIHQYLAEIEQLRERLQEAAKLNLELMGIRHTNEAEIDRLRELLRYGLEHHDEYNWQKRVREALGCSDEQD